MPASMPSTTETEMARNQRPSFRAPMASWSTPGGEHDHAEGGQPELVDGLEDQHGQTGGGAGDLEAAARQQAGDETADDAGDQAEFGRDAGGDGHAHAQRQGDQEDDEGGGEVLPQVRELGRRSGVIGGPHSASKRVGLRRGGSRTAPVCTS